MFRGLETGIQKTEHSALSNWREHGMTDPEKMPTNGKRDMILSRRSRITHDAIQCQDKVFQEIS
jgi:hypothetical protein